jgi:hypothetical protein
MLSMPCNSVTPPAWLPGFINDVIQGFIDDCGTAPLGCHFYRDNDLETWEVTLFVSRTEVWSGAEDGRPIPLPFQIDVLSVCAAFDILPVMHWQTEKIAADDELGNHLSFEGIAKGAKVWLRILKDAPAWADPGRLVHAGTGQIQDTW